MINGLKLSPIFVLSLILMFNNFVNAQDEIQSVKIGLQEWMVENLNVDHYRNGDSIPEVKSQQQWSDLKTGAWCYYKNDSKNGEKYGKLYNWYAVNDPRGLAPKGWRIPSQSELLELQSAVNDNSNLLKAVGEGSGSGTGTNSTGFSVKLGGYRGYHGNYYYIGYDSYFWTSSEGTPPFASSMYVYSTGNYIFFYDFDKVYGFSVRCIRD
ncbi:MAG: fibrobacter succinogenes major paralogous domain-containing protein [Ignavibacteria bacterium]|nr:fibrobacter succinogenes major paralogous domain-containing protein [Ignavibacteria bacterium]